jgi:hypothetical protein
MPHVFDHTPTAQEIFDQACVYFATSPGPSTMPRSYGDTCRYRQTETKRECVAGHFIPDEMYVPAMDNLTLIDAYKGGGTGIENLWFYLRGKLPEWFGTHLGLLKSLQKVHDEQHNWTDHREWVYGGIAADLSRIATINNLNPSAIAQVEARKAPIGWQSVEA